MRPHFLVSRGMRRGRQPLLVAPPTGPDPDPGNGEPPDPGELVFPLYPVFGADLITDLPEPAQQPSDLPAEPTLVSTAQQLADAVRAGNDYIRVTSSFPETWLARRDEWGDVNNALVEVPEGIAIGGMNAGHDFVSVPAKIVKVVGPGTLAGAFLTVEEGEEQGGIFEGGTQDITLEGLQLNAAPFEWSDSINAQRGNRISILHCVVRAGYPTGQFGGAYIGDANNVFFGGSNVMGSPWAGGNDWGARWNGGDRIFFADTYLMSGGAQYAARYSGHCGHAGFLRGALIALGFPGMFEDVHATLPTSIQQVGHRDVRYLMAAVNEGASLIALGKNTEPTAQFVVESPQFYAPDSTFVNDTALANREARADQGEVIDLRAGDYDGVDSFHYLDLPDPSQQEILEAMEALIDWPVVVWDGHTIGADPADLPLVLEGINDD